MHDGMIYGRNFRVFNIVDDFNREAFSIEINLNFPAQRVRQDRAKPGHPMTIRMEKMALTPFSWTVEHKAHRSELDIRMDSECIH